MRMVGFSQEWQKKIGYLQIEYVKVSYTSDVIVHWKFYLMSSTNCKSFLWFIWLVQLTSFGLFNRTSILLPSQNCKHSKIRCSLFRPRKIKKKRVLFQWLHLFSNAHTTTKELYTATLSSGINLRFMHCVTKYEEEHEISCQIVVIALDNWDVQYISVYGKSDGIAWSPYITCKMSCEAWEILNIKVSQY